MRSAPHLAALALLVTVAAAPRAQEMPPLETNFQKYSYAIGLQIGRNMRQQGQGEIDAAALAAGIEDVLGGRGLRVPPEEMRAAILGYQQESMAKRVETAERNELAGSQFLAENKDAEGVAVLPSGVQYRVVEAGVGDLPEAGDTVIVHYRGKLLDGTEFDSSYGRGTPTELQLGQVIEGWKQALAQMKVGAKWQVWIPPGLAYGENGAGSVIGPNETLYFDIELIGIKDDG